jgi:hypothetical protein
MAISSTDQHSISEPEISIKEPGVDDDELADDEEAPAAPEARQRADGTQKPVTPRVGGKQGGDSRRDRRGAFRSASEQMRNEVLESVRSEMGQFKTQFQQMMDQARTAAQPATPAAQAGPSAYDKRLSEVTRAMQAEMSAYQNHNPKSGAYDLTRYNELAMQEKRLIAEGMTYQTLERLGLTPEMVQRMKNPQQGPDVATSVAMNARYQQVAQAYPWIEKADANGKFTNATAVARMRDYLEAAGRPPGIQTDLEAAAKVQNELGLAPNRAPRANPAPYQGVSSGERGGAAGPREVRMPAAAMRGLSKDEMAMVSKAVFSEE